MDICAMRMGERVDDRHRKEVDSWLTTASGIPALGVVCSLAAVIFYGYRIAGDLLGYIDDCEEAQENECVLTSYTRLEGHFFQDGNSMGYHCMNVATLGSLGMNILAGALEMSMTVGSSDNPPSP